jgi:proteasome lid subunit RPN8/RPN11
MVGLKDAPDAARSKIVGVYHTHGGPNPIVSGEDFSGFEYGQGSNSPTMLGS